VKCKEKGLVGAIKPIMHQLREDIGFWMNDKLIERVLQEVGEEEPG
jgi:predicted nucleic acid-binding protein